MLVLDLSYNKIIVFTYDSFSGLNNLEVLNISHNQLGMPDDFISGVFSPLKSLKMIKMQ